jgi:glucuronoarabinoxylan endo-1,4-beta-xylanase
MLRAGVALLLAGAASGQTITNVVDGFDPAGIRGSSYSGGQIGAIWMNWFGDAFRSVTWDSAADANGNAGSGSMKITANFDGAGATPNQFEVYDGLNGIVPGLNGSQFTNFQCDVRFASGSATSPAGATPVFGHLEFGAHNGFSQDYFGSIDVPASNTNWVHVSIPLNAAADPNLTNITDVLIHIYGPYYSPGLSGAMTLWVDNIKFVGAAPVPTNCVVAWTNVFQRIDGFGASSAFDSSWTAAQADMFFSTNTGIGLSLLRSRIAPDGTTVEAGIMQMARDRGAKIWSAPWSPPAAFKDSHTVNGGNFLSASNQAYANQLAHYVQTMKSTYQVDVTALSVQNEPDFNTTNYESCIWTGQQIHDFVPYLYRALSNAGVPSTKILIAESDHWSFDLTANSINDPVTSNMVGVLAAHDYDYTVAPVNNGGKPLWETEVSTYENFDGSIANGLYWAGQIHTFLTYAQVNAWHFWWLSPYPTDNESLVNNAGQPAKRMYVLGQYSRFVRPGFYRIGVVNNSATSISAFKDPASGRFAIVAINSGATDLAQTFNLAAFTATSVTPWVTSASLSLASQPAVAITNAAFAYTLPASSVVTFVGQAQPRTPTLAVSVAGSQIGLTLGGPGGAYTLSSSTNLIDWEPLLVTNPPVSPITYFQPLSTVTHFYRLALGQ